MKYAGIFLICNKKGRKLEVITKKELFKGPNNFLIDSLNNEYIETPIYRDNMRVALIKGGVN